MIKIWWNPEIDQKIWYFFPKVWNCPLDGAAFLTMYSETNNYKDQSET